MNGYPKVVQLQLAILISLLAYSCCQSSTYYSFTVLPSSSYIDVNGSYLAQASPQACYADCQSCQILTNLCEQCYVPYFSKTPQGTCPLTSAYTLQSSSNQIRSGAAFSIAADSWTNEQVVNCSARNNKQNFQGDMVAIQPLVSTQRLTFNRTLSLHNYLMIRFELITTNWTAGSNLDMQLYNQANSPIVPGGFQVNYLPNVPKESLCSAGAIDQRFSITIKVQDVNTTALSASWLSTSGTISIATFALISGLCDASCSSCSYSIEPTACLGCNYFLKQISDGSCSECPAGFKFTTASGYSFCQKCPIQYQSCTASQTSCYYVELNATTSNDCSLIYQNSHYDESYFINDQTFPGSLFTVNGLPSPSQYVSCGDQPLSSYTYVGPALAYQPVIRIFANLRPHLSLSLSFNVFAVDADYTSRNTKFQIYLNGQLYDVRYLTLTGMSNICGGDLLETFTSFPPTQFYQNNQTDLNLTLVADAAWGIRNLRIVYEVCDTNCLVCSSLGCERCIGYLQVRDGKCQDCPKGFGRNQSASIENACFRCPTNCLNCTLSSSKAVQCLLCSQPFFLFEKSCQKKTNVADTITPGSLVLDNSSALANTSTCSLIFPTGSDSSNLSLSNVTTPFIISSKPLTTVTTLSQVHYRSIVEFYLLRLGQWSSEDRVDVYLNDLLMLSKNYSSYGNKWCTNNTNTSDTDFLSFESLDFQDNNQSLSIHFEVVSKNSIPRTFGVGQLKVYPVGCKACLIYPFTFRIQYNYDEALNVVVEFSRVYRQTNQTLFKQIFVLTLSGKQLPYQILSNNSVIYTLQAYPSQDILQGKLLLKCVYPELVTTNINDTINGEEPFFSRLLQQTSAYSNSKVVDNSDSSTNVVRFVPVQNQSALNGVKTFFQIMTRIVIYVGFALFFFGLQTIGTHFMHNLQKIWLHIFLAALAAPALLRQALTGFRQSQNQNIAVNPSKWQSGLPEQLYYDSRSYFYEYYTDINFFRNIYNIGLAFGILIIYLVIMHVIAKKYITREMTESNNFLRHWKVTFHRRPYFYVNSIIFYQYLTLVLACMLQFINLSNQTQQGAFSGISAAAAVVAFIIATIYPLFHFLWLRHKQDDMGRGLQVQFSNRYHEIFFRFVKREIWADGEISYTERFYNLYRFGQLWWYCLVVTALAYNPQAQLFLLLITQALHLFLVLYTKLSRNFFFRICKVLELAFFVGLEVIMLVCQSQKETLTERSLRSLGGVAIAFIFIIIFLSLARSIYNAYLLHKEYKYRGMEGKIHARQGEVIRRDEYYASDEEGEELVGTERV